MDAKQLILDLYSIGAFKFGSFTLKSGIQSPIYLDLRLIVSYPKILTQISEALWEKIKNLTFDLICGVPYTALPIATALSLSDNIPMVLRRKESKDYGTKKMIEGVFEKGQTCLIIEDVITSGTSVIETIDALHQEGLQVRDIAVVVDREQGGKEKLEEKGYFVHSLFGMEDLLQTLHQEGNIDSNTVEAVREFIKSSRVALLPKPQATESL
ncbi:MAG TPA: orotate phosphoribosyltransferase [Rhabdochlamydiaceae bacterium]|nr:orotate phosphoribosyltransferase [Rhabdochlamydiaceae bacterium]